MYKRQLADLSASCKSRRLKVSLAAAAAAAAAVLEKLDPPCLPVLDSSIVLYIYFQSVAGCIRLLPLS